MKDIKRINSWALHASWSDGLHESMCASLPEYLAEEINIYLRELEEHRAEVDDEYSVSEDDTYDEYGVNTKNSFNTPPKKEETCDFCGRVFDDDQTECASDDCPQYEPHPSGVTAEWNGEDWVFKGELIQHHWGMSSTCFSPSELGYTYNDAARLSSYKAIDALVLWLAAD